MRPATIPVVVVLVAALLLLVVVQTCRRVPVEATGPVPIELGDDWQYVVDGYLPGATFVVQPGVHRGASVTVRDGDRFVGEPGAVMLGSEVLEEFREEDGIWVHAGIGADPVLVGQFDEGAERHGLRHDLFLDGRLLFHVPEPAPLGPDEWFYDLVEDRVLLGTDPTGHVVEISAQEHAFAGPDTTGVTIEGLDIRQYAAPAQSGAINGEHSIDWAVREVRVTQSHAAGIRIGGGMSITESVLEANGQLGLTGSADAFSPHPVRVSGSTIRGNGTLGYTWFWEKGGMKLVDTIDAVVEDNLIVDNVGPGVWFDVRNQDAQIIDNTIRGNTTAGIIFELSDGALITGNTIVDNAHDVDPRLAAGISITNSGGAVVRTNELAGNTNELVVIHADREAMGTPPERIVVEDNDITIDGGFVGVSILTDRTDLYDVEAMGFADNRYRLNDCEPCFFWDERVSSEFWRALGLDEGSQFTVGAAR